MKRIMLMAILLSKSLITAAQIHTIPQYALDTAVRHTFRGSVGALMQSSYADRDERIDIRFNLTLGANYIGTKHEFMTTLDWYNDAGSSPGDSTHRAYIMAGACLFKYKNQNGRLIQRDLFVAPIYMFNKNSDRGLEWRHQAGILFQPFGFKSKKMWFNVLIGGVYSYASWDTYNDDAVGRTTSGISVSKKSTKVNEFEPMVMINFCYRPTQWIGIDLTGYYQQPTVNPHPNVERTTGVIKDTKKLYPHIVMDFSTRFEITRGLSLQAKLKADYEKTRPTIFKKGFEWNSMIGINWRFSTTK